MNRISLCVAAATLAAASAASAATNVTPELDQRIDQVFEALDLDADGALDASEASGNESLGAAFPRLATDGRLDRQRFADWYRSYDMEPAQE